MILWWDKPPQKKLDLLQKNSIFDPRGTAHSSEPGSKSTHKIVEVMGGFSSSSEIRFEACPRSGSRAPSTSSTLRPTWSPLLSDRWSAPMSLGIVLQREADLPPCHLPGWHHFMPSFCLLWEVGFHLGPSWPQPASILFGLPVAWPLPSPPRPGRVGIPNGTLAGKFLWPPFLVSPIPAPPPGLEKKAGWAPRFPTGGGGRAFSPTCKSASHPWS